MTNLTRHPTGSIRELWSISLPLMLSMLSLVSMIFVDRLFLARYSTEALNAAVIASTFGWVFLNLWQICSSISEVFVAQFNGAKLKERLGEPVWQMLWLGIFSTLFFAPLSLFGAEWFYGTGVETEMERTYFRWMMAFGPAAVFYSALCGFFVGQGKTKLVTTVAISMNFVNASLDYLLIFGWEGWIPPLGIQGAAIATSSAVVLQVVVLAAVFFSRQNRETLGTNRWNFQAPLFRQCVRIGLPGALSAAGEVLGWALFYRIHSDLGLYYTTPLAISQSLVLFLWFVIEGLSKGTTAIAGNLIGAGRQEFIPQVLRSGVCLCLLFAGGLMLMHYFLADFLIGQFLPFETGNEFAQLREVTKTALFCLWIYISIESIRFLYVGVLVAAGDTLYLMITGILSIWLFMFLPVYFIVIQGGQSVIVSVIITVGYAIAISGLNIWRYWTGSWRKRALLVFS